MAFCCLQHLRKRLKMLGHPMSPARIRKKQNAVQVLIHRRKGTRERYAIPSPVTIDAKRILTCVGLTWCGMSCNNDPLRGKISSKFAPSGCRNSFSSGSDGKATRDDLHRKEWDGSSCGLVWLRLLPNCPSVPQEGALLGGKMGSLLKVN